MSANPAEVVPTLLRPVPVRLRRTLTSLVAVTAIAASLSACFLLPSRIQEGGNGIFGSVDTDALGTAVTATSPNIESTFIDVSIDGLGHSLYVKPVLLTDSLTSAELDSVLRTAFEMSIGDVQSIEVRTVNTDDDPLDVSSAAAELGIQYSALINSVTYSTVYLAEAYGE